MFQLTCNPEQLTNLHSAPETFSTPGLVSQADQQQVHFMSSCQATCRQDCCLRVCSLFLDGREWLILMGCLKQAWLFEASAAVAYVSRCLRAVGERETLVEVV